MITTFDEESAKRIAATVRAHERKSPLRNRPPKKRPIFDGADLDPVSAELVGVCAVVKGTVPASSNVNTTGPMYTGNETNLLGVQVFTPGVLPLAFDFSTYLFNAGAVICNPDGTAAVRTLSDGTKEPVVAEVVNPSYTDFHGGDGVITTGSLVEIDGETARFILSWPDLRAMPHHEAGDPPTAGDDASQQVIRHKGGEDNYEASFTEDCG